MSPARLPLLTFAALWCGALSLSFSSFAGSCHDLKRIADTLFRPAIKESERSAKYTPRQRAAVAKVLAWIKTYGRPPRTTEFRTGEGKVGIEGNTFFGRRDGRKRNYVFESPSEAWVAVWELAPENGVSFDLLDVSIADPTPTVRTIWRQEATRRVVDWMAAGEPPRKPGTGDWEIDVDPSAFFSTGEYGKGSAHWRQRIFDSQSDGWLAIWLAARKRGVPFQLLDISITNPSDAVRDIWRIEGINRVLGWMNATTPPRFPRDAVKDWSQGMGLDMAAFLGTGDYRPGGGRRHQRIFDSSGDAWLNVWRAARAQGTPFELLDVRMKEQSSQEIRDIWKAESLKRIETWMKARPAHKLEKKDFGSWSSTDSNKIRVDVDDFQGTGRSHNTNVFDSASEAWLETKKYLRERNIDIRLIDLGFRNPSEAALAEMRLEVCDAVLDWSAKNGWAKPGRKDFGKDSNRVGVDWRLFAGERDDRNRRYYFDSSEEGFDAVKARAAARGLRLDWE